VQSRVSPLEVDRRARRRGRQRSGRCCCGGGGGPIPSFRPSTQVTAPRRSPKVRGDRARPHGHPSLSAIKLPLRRRQYPASRSCLGQRPAVGADVVVQLVWWVSPLGIPGDDRGFAAAIAQSAGAPLISVVAAPAAGPPRHAYSSLAYPPPLDHRCPSSAYFITPTSRTEIGETERAPLPRRGAALRRRLCGKWHDEAVPW
jgi:hypothetical protein